jgi:cobalt transporter subunit CbtA
MIGRVLLAALLAGVVAGIVLGAIQHVRISPLILAAETYEKAADAAQAGAQPSGGCAETMPGMTMCGDDGAGWEPSPGLERTAYTTAASMLAGAGYAALLAGVSLVLGLPLTRGNGLIWGLCGFLAVTVATGAGLPPEVPGMPVADLLPRQIWWLGTVAATGAALYLIAARRKLWSLAVAVVLIALPHIIGAPQPPSTPSTIPAGLAASFAANTVAAAAVFWALIGLFTGIAIERAAPELKDA